MGEEKVLGDFVYEVVTLGGGGSANGESYVRIIKFQGSEISVAFPSQIEGLPVKILGRVNTGIFLYPNPTTSVSIPTSVTTIESGAFSFCELLRSVSIPESVTRIGSGAFSGCSSLQSINLPSGLTCIEENMFSNCTSLTSVTIGNAVTSINTNAFYNCSRLASIIIPSSVTRIEWGAFQYCSALSSVAIPTSVTSIFSVAFAYCSGLTSITIPNSVTFLGSSVFEGCTSVTSFTIPDRFIAQVAQLGLGGQIATDYLINALANNDAFVTAVANKIKATGGNYGIATQSGLSSAITAAVQPLATKSELTSSLAQSRTDGINSVLSNPNLWTLYTTSQIQNMAVGDLVLTRQVSGGFVLNYDIEQSTDLQTWTPYQALSLPLTGLPTDKAFVRIKAKQ